MRQFISHVPNRSKSPLHNSWKGAAKKTYVLRAGFICIGFGWVFAVGWFFFFSFWTDDFYWFQLFQLISDNFGSFIQLYSLNCGRLVFFRNDLILVAKHKFKIFTIGSGL